MKNPLLIPRTSTWRIVEFSSISGGFATKILFHSENSWIVPIVSGSIVFAAYALVTNLYWKLNPEVLDVS